MPGGGTVYVANAGVDSGAGLDTEDEVWARVIEVNVMAHVLGKPMLQIFGEFQGKHGHLTGATTGAQLVAELGPLGVDVEEKEDGMIIRGPATITPTTAVKSFGDHRIAMSMAILGLYATAPVVVNNVACVDTSFPGFWQYLKDLGGHVE